MPTALRSALCVAAIAAATMTPLTAQPDPAAATPHRAAAASMPTTDFTAGVRSIHHASGTVTFVGTAPVGTSVELAGDVLEPVWTEADGTGSWSASVRVRSGDPHVVRITSPVSGRVIEVPVQALVLIPPTMGGTVDTVSRSLALDGSGHPGARFAIADGGEQIGETDVDPDGHWHVTAQDLSFGVHHVTAVETFDGAVNGTVEEDYELDGAATVTDASASRVTGRVSLAGTAPTGTRLGFAVGGSDVQGTDGRPLDVEVGPDGRWKAAFPIPAGARLVRIDVATHDHDHGGGVVGTTSADVVVPDELVGSVEQDPDGSWLLAGTGELGGTVSVETEAGTVLQTPDGSAIETEIGPPAQTGGYTWRLRVSPDAVPDDVDVVVARQRVHGVEQGALRLVLPGRGHRPGPETGGGAGVSTGTHPQAPHAAAGRLVSGQARLAYTGTELVGTLAVSAVLGSLGTGLLLASRTRRRRTRTP